MRLAQLRAHLGLITLLTLGVALRVFLMLEYQPAALSNPDSGRFLYFAHDGERLFTDNYGPAAYEALLRLARAPESRLRRVDLANDLLLTPSGVTRLLDGLDGFHRRSRQGRSGDPVAIDVASRMPRAGSGCYSRGAATPPSSQYFI